MCGQQNCVWETETGRTLQKRVTEHKYAVRIHSVKNDIAVHTWSRGHRVDWDSARAVALAPYSWERRVTEALHIRQQANNNKPRLWPPHQSHMEPHPQSSLPTYRLPETTNPPNFTRLSTTCSSIPFSCFKFQNFNSNY